MNGPVLIGLVVAAAAAGGAAGYGIRASERDRIVDALAAQSAELQTLRQALPANPPITLRRDEVVALVEPGATRPPASAATVAPVMISPPPAAEPATVEGARRVVDDAVAEGRWTNRRRDDLRGLLRRADAQTRDEALRYLSIAANRDALTLETDGPPL